MSSGKNDVDFDFFDDPPGSSRSQHSVKRGRSPEHKGSRSPSVSKSRSRSRSRSPSYSRSRSRSRSRSPSRSRSNSARSRDSYSDDFSDHGSEHSAHRSRSPSPVESKQPYVVVSRSSSKTENKKHGDGYHSDSSVDSDVTDVSPLNSPTEKRRYTKGNQKEQFRPVKDLDECNSKGFGKPPNSGKRRPTSAKSNETYSKGDERENEDSLNMKILMEVLDMEQGDPQREEQFARARKVLFAPQGAKPYGKKNYSFPNDKVDDIDRENQRLMRKIMTYAQERNSLKQRTMRRPAQRKAKPVMTASAVNRQRQQQKIEQENLALLKRLQSTRPTTTLRRDKLLHDYQDKMIAGQSVAAAHAHHFCPSSTYTRTKYDHSYSMSDMTEPATVILNNDSSKRMSRPTSATTYLTHGNRPMSGKRRPQSATVRSDRY